MEQWLVQLIAQGKVRGSLTYDEVNALLPEMASPELTAPVIERVLDALEREGIALVEGDEPEEPLPVTSPTP